MRDIAQEPEKNERKCTPTYPSTKIPAFILSVVSEISAQEKLSTSVYDKYWQRFAYSGSMVFSVSEGFVVIIRHSLTRSRSSENAKKHKNTSTTPRTIKLTSHNKAWHHILSTFFNAIRSTMLAWPKSHAPTP